MTPFPVKPGDVATLTVQEFAFYQDLHAPPSFDLVCRRFVDDSNRAFVWWIRYRALKAWWAQAEKPLSATSEQACAVAAHFKLNAEWKFDAEPFRRALESAPSRRRARPTPG
jgi:hypothetical protein